MNNRYLKPKKAVCSVCGDKIKVGEKYALGTVCAFLESSKTGETEHVDGDDEIFCGFCKPTKVEYEINNYEVEKIYKYVKIENDRYGRSELVHFNYWIVKKLNFYRNEKEDEES